MSTQSERPTDEWLLVEGWGQGFMVGCLIVMVAVTVSNMRKGVLLHKLILTELFLAMAHGTFIFAHPPGYGWYLSASAVGLYSSWSLHNVISWFKNKPFLSQNVSRFYIATVILVQPYWVVETVDNFLFFNRGKHMFEITRPMEPFFRDPWWVFTTCSVFFTIKRGYNFSILEIIQVSPRFGIMLLSMCLSLAFIVIDEVSVFNGFGPSLPTGVEPFWKLSLIFKCLCDTVVLDDFKTALDKMRRHSFQKQVGLPLHQPRNQAAPRPVSFDAAAGNTLSSGSFSKGPASAHIDHAR